MKLGEVCDHCHLQCTEEMLVAVSGDYADPCIGILPGIRFACCGHGKSRGYLLFENGVVIDIFDGDVIPDFYRTFDNTGVVQLKSTVRVPIGDKKG